MAGADPFTDWQVEALLKAAANRSRREAAWVTLLVQTGFRPRELLRCTIAEVCDGTIVRDWLHVRRARLKGGRSHRRRSVTGRTTPLSQRSIAALTALLTERSQATPLHPKAPLFVSRNGGPLSLWRANAILKELIREAGFSGAGRFSLHSGRKTFAARVYQASRCLLTTRDALGHAHCSTTEVYLGSRYREAASVITRIWDSRVPLDSGSHGSAAAPNAPATSAQELSV